MKSRIQAMILLALLVCSASPGASDIDRERRWADDIVPSLVVGEAHWLQADGQAFLAIYAESSGQPQGGVILVHGMGIHPDWPDVVHPLRVTLPDHGWATLSLQMPIAGNNAPFYEYAALFAEVPARIEAGIAFFKEQGITNIALVGHSLGAMMGLYYLAGQANPQIRAFAAVGLSVPRDDPQIDVIDWLGKLNMPVLDLYGEQDMDAVKNTAKARKGAARRAKRYEQVEIPAANHFFHGLDDVLIKRVRSWLNRAAPGQPVSPRG